MRTEIMGTQTNLPMRSSVPQRPSSRDVFAYLRVSTGEQDLASQRHGILDYAQSKGLQPLSFVSETVSGTVPSTERVLGKELLPKLCQGDVLIVAELSRLGRSVLDILTTLRELAKRGVTVHVVKGGFQLDGSLNSKILTTVLSLAAEIERELICQRTKEGQARAKLAGKHIGRPKGSGGHSKLDIRNTEIRQLATKGVTRANLARIFECDWETMNKWLIRHDVKVKKEAV